MSSKPEMKAALDKVLAKNAGTPQFVRLVDKFNLTDRYPEVLAMIQSNPNRRVGRGREDPGRQGETSLKKALAGEDVAKVVATIKALGGGEGQQDGRPR